MHCDLRCNLGRTSTWSRMNHANASQKISLGTAFKFWSTLLGLENWRSPLPGNYIGITGCKV